MVLIFLKKSGLNTLKRSPIGDTVRAKKFKEFKIKLDNLLVKRVKESQCDVVIDILDQERGDLGSNPHLVMRHIQ